MSPPSPARAQTGTGVLWLWGLALLALPIHNVRWRGQRLPLQPAEIAALPLLAYAAVAWVRGRRPRPAPVDLGVAAWVGGLLVATALTVLLRERGAATVAVRELVVAGYLAALYLAIRVTASVEVLRRFPALFALAAAVAAGLGVIGSVLNASGFQTVLALPADAHYPYFGSAARAHGLAITPAMLASILTPALLLTVFAWSTGRRTRLAVGAVLALGFAFTLSKAIFCLIAGFAAAAWVARRHAGRSCPPRGALVVAVVLLAAGYVVTSHVVVMPASGDRRIYERTMVSEEPLARLSLGSREYVVMRTSYFINKRTSLLAIARTFPLGVGPGYQPRFARALRAEGLYPQLLYLGAPHSTYFGALAEGGLAGLLGLAGFLGALSIAIARLTARDDVPPGFAAAAVGALVALLVESLAIDAMHFRHYWWLTAVVAAWSAEREPSTAG